MADLPTILVVDDDDQLRRVIVRVLARAGYCVLESSDGAAGLSAMRDTVVDAVVSDVQMPGMDGATLLAEMLALRPNVPIVLMTGANPGFDTRGAYHLLMKPFTPESLREVVERALAA
jgi:DNA-binding NtrC family response regulator